MRVTLCTTADMWAVGVLYLFKNTIMIYVYDKHHVCHISVIYILWPVYLCGWFIVLCSWPRPLRIISYLERTWSWMYRRRLQRPARSRTSSRVSWITSKKERQRRWTPWMRNARRRMPAPRSLWTASSIRSRPRSAKAVPRRTSPGLLNHRRKSTSRTPPTRPRTPSTRPRTRPRTSKVKSSTDEPLQHLSDHSLYTIIIFILYRTIIIFHSARIKQWASLSIRDNVLSNAVKNACHNIIRTFVDN